MKLTLVLLAIAAAPLAAQTPATPADAVYFHGHILTGEGLQNDTPQFVTAIVVSQGKILAATDDKSAIKQAGTSARKVDLHGTFVMPGFNDAHLHLGLAGKTKLSVDLTGIQSLEDMEKRVRLAAMVAPPDHWVTGAGWDHTLWVNKALPTRSDLDAVTAGHPAIFERIDGHIAVANSAALSAAGITSTTPDPQGGKIDRGPNGEATGILRESPAMKLVYIRVPAPTQAARQRGLELAMADALSHGVTSAQDNSDWDDFLTMETMEKNGKLPMRITEWLAFTDPVDLLKQHRAAHDASDQLLRTGMLKGFMDGSLGSRTAALKSPYSDDGTNSGIPRFEQASLNAMTIERSRAGFQIGFHAIGDRAAAMALDAYSAAEADAKQNGSTSLPSTRRFRIEHAQVVDASDIPRFKTLGVIASMQPNHLLTDMRWAEARLGPERAKYSYAWKAYLAKGVPLAFGTDYPVEPVTPFRGIYAAITRMDEAGKQTYYQQNSLTISQAIYAYTLGSAYAEFSEKWKGKLLPGYVADFIVLDRDLTAIPPAQILKTQVMQTYVGGEQVYLGGVHIASGH